MNMIEQLSNNVEIVEILEIIEKLNLKDSCLCAGTIRNNIWNLLSGRVVNFKSDVDIVFFDREFSEELSKEIESNLNATYPRYSWEVCNQAFVHTYNSNTKPYTSTEDALSRFPETCTAIGLKLNHGEINLIAPHGVEDLLNFVVRPTPHFVRDEERMLVYMNRQVEKNWIKEWSKITYKEF